jgi:hypothetical protein
VERVETVVNALRPVFTVGGERVGVSGRLEAVNIHTFTPPATGSDVDAG